MSGAQTTLSLQDRLSGSLQKVMRAMDSTIRVMENMDAATQQLDKGSLANARRNIDEASADLSRLTSSMNSTAESASEAAVQQERMNQSMNNLNTAGAQGLSDTIGDVAASANSASQEIARIGLDNQGITGSIQNLNNMDKSVNTVSNSVADVNAILDRASQGFEGVSKTTQEATRTSQDYSRTLSRMKPPSVLERIRNAFRLTGRETDKTTEKQNRFQKALDQLRPSAALERLKSVIKQSGDSADDARNKMQRFNDSLKNGEVNARGLAAGLLAAVGAYKILNTVKDVLSDAISQGVNFHAFRQASEVAFTTFLGDAQKAQQYMDDMYAFALKTPFAYPDLLESSRNLIAFGIAAENTFPIMQSIGDAVAAVGGGNAEMKNMANIFGQIQSQGRLTMMEVNRLSQYGVNSIEMLAEAAGTTGDQIRKDITAGAIDAGTAMTVLVEGMDKQFGGLMEGVKGTWRGAVDSLNSARRNAGAAMMQDFMEPLTQAVNTVTNLFNKIPSLVGPAVAAFIPLIDMFNEVFGGDRFDAMFSSIAMTLGFVANMLSWVGQSALWVAGIFADNWAFIAPILVVMATVIGVIIAILLIKYTVLGLIRLATLAWAAAQWVVNAAYLSNPIVWVLLIIVAVIALVIYAMVAWADQTAAVIGAIVGSVFWLGTVFWNILLGIANFGILVAEWFVNVWNSGIYLVQLGWIGFMTLVYSILDAIGNGALAVAEFFINTWNGALFLVQNGFHNLLSFVLTIVGGIAKGVEGVINTALGAISDLINAAVSGLNSLIGMINKIPGVNISTVGNVDLTIGDKASSAIESLNNSLVAPTKAAAANLGRLDMAGDYAANANAPTAPEKASFDRLEYADPSAAFSKGQEIGSNASLAASDKLTGAMDKMTGMMKGGDQGSLFNAGEVPTAGFDPMLGGIEAPGAADSSKAPGSGRAKKGASNPTGGKIDSIGGIDDEINIADEDLKMLRDLADRNSVRNVTTTLTPTVQFTGDMTIREEADIKKITKDIEKTFIDEIARSAEGVYS